MRIRSATAADIPALMTLQNHAATAAHWSLQQYERALSGQGPSRVVLIVEQQGGEEQLGEEEVGVQGFIVGRSLDKEWEIENIAVAGPAQRHGLGTRLLEEFLDLARSRGAVAVFLEVRESNLAARRLYEKGAFVESGRRKLYYREPEEDAIVYQIGFA